MLNNPLAVKSLMRGGGMNAVIRALRPAFAPVEHTAIGWRT